MENKEIEKRVRQLAENNSQPLDVVRKKFESLLEERMEEKPGLEEKHVAHSVLSRLETRLGQMGDYSSVTATILGKGDAFDKNSRQRSIAENKKEEEFDMAVARGYIDKEGNPLIREEMPAFDDDKVGEKLPVEYIQSVMGINKDDELFKLLLSGDSIQEWESIEKGDEVEAYLIENDGALEGVINYNWATSSTVEKVGEKDVYKEIERLKDSVKHNIADMRSFIKETESLSDYNRAGVVTGYVSGLFLEQNRRMVINDIEAPNEKNGVTVWLPDKEKIPFGQDTKVYVIGTFNLGDPFDEQEKRPLVINSTGVVPHPKLQWPREG